MVFKVLAGGSTSLGDLYNAADNYGYFDDVVYSTREEGGFRYDVYTYRGRDLIDLRDAGSTIVHIVFAGADDDRVLGGPGALRVNDQSGNDLYSLGGRDDFVYAGTGNDTVDGGGGTDTLDFTRITDDFAAETFPTVSLRVDLRLTTAQDLGLFGRDVIRNIEAVYSSVGDDVLIGNSGANTLSASLGNDRLEGMGGDDFLVGGLGRDTITGGQGIDRIDAGASMFVPGPVSGDGQADVIRFRSIADGARGLEAGTTDTILSFEAGGRAGGGAAGDRIDLSRIDARAGTAPNDAFVFRGGAAEFTLRRGEVRIVETGGSSVVLVDNDRDAAAEMTIVVQGVTGLDAGDFIL